MSGQSRLPIRTKLDGCQVVKATNQTFNTTASVGVTFDGAYTFKTDPGYHDPVTNNTRFIATKPGLYSLGMSLTFSTTGNAVISVRTRVNGDTSTPEFGQNYTTNCTRLAYSPEFLFLLNTNDYVEMFVSLASAVTYTTTRAIATFLHHGTA
jgi:hypothetical protein